MTLEDSLICRQIAFDRLNCLARGPENWELPMLRILAGLLTLANLLFASTLQAQQLDTSLSDRQIAAKILQECRELYLRTVGPCACAGNRARNGSRCAKDLPETFNPFCTRKDVTLNEIRLYRMQNLGFIDQRCSK